MDGNGYGVHFSVEQDDLINGNGVLVGRDDNQCDFVITDFSVSRTHARIYYKHGALWIQDLNSSNGTSVDHVLLRAGDRRRLRDNSNIIIGSVRLTASKITEIPLANSGAEFHAAKDNSFSTASVTPGSSGGLGFLFACVVFLFVTNPTESDIKEVLRQEMTSKLHNAVDADNKIESFAAGIADSFMPQIVDAALDINRKNMFLFSLYSVRLSPLAESMAKSAGAGNMKFPLCYIGAATKFFPYDCKK